MILKPISTFVLTVILLKLYTNGKESFAGRFAAFSRLTSKILRVTLLSTLNATGGLRMIFESKEVEI